MKSPSRAPGGRITSSVVAIECARGQATVSPDGTCGNALALCSGSPVDWSARAGRSAGRLVPAVGALACAHQWRASRREYP
eukprot:scaffold214072_cov36-Tisochrysis_lutea.AAC.1